MSPSIGKICTWHPENSSNLVAWCRRYHMMRIADSYRLHMFCYTSAGFIWSYLYAF